MVPWKESESDKLIDLYSKYPNNWVKIAERFKNRESDECRIWYTKINAKVHTGRWSQDEVQLLMKLYKKYGGRWALIAEKLPGRTSLQIKDKFRTLKKGTTKKDNQEFKTNDNDSKSSPLKNTGPQTNFSSKHYDIINNNNVGYFELLFLIIWII
jgi:hypothetical protein